MKPGSRSIKVAVPIEERPIEWDFRWVNSEEEADHVYLLELTREVIRQADVRLGKPKEKKALMALVKIMALAATGLLSRKDADAVKTLEKTQFMVGVMTAYATTSGDLVGRLPAAFVRMKTLRSIASQPRGVVVGIKNLPLGQPFTPLSFSGESYHLLRIPKGATAKMAKDDFALWADDNLPKGKVPLGGRPDLHSLKLLRLAFYRFDQAWEHPRPYAGFAVAVRANAKGDMAPAFTDFGKDWYDPFMQPMENQPKSATWSEAVSAAKLEIAPLVAELVAAAKSFA
jgi:hypothetical protein